MSDEGVGGALCFILASWGARSAGARPHLPTWTAAQCPVPPHVRRRAEAAVAAGALACGRAASHARLCRGPARRRPSYAYRKSLPRGAHAYIHAVAARAPCAHTALGLRPGVGAPLSARRARPASPTRGARWLLGSLIFHLRDFDVGFSSAERTVDKDGGEPPGTWSLTRRRARRASG